MAKRIPVHHSRLIPYHHYRDPDAAIAFLDKAFGFSLRFAHRDDAGRVLHAQVAVGDATLMLGPARGEFQQASAAELGRLHSSVWCYVPDVDAHFAQARAAGATILREPRDQPYGVREYDALDCEGQEWYFVTPLGERKTPPAPSKLRRKPVAARTAKPSRRASAVRRKPARKR